MARKIETREIGFNRYRAKQLKVRKANRVLERILKIVGEPIGALADNVGTGEDGVEVALIGDLKRGALSEAAEKLVKSLSGDDINWLVEELRTSLEYQTPDLRESDENKFVPMTGDIWDDEFAGLLMDQFKVIAWVLELNYGSFFEGVGGIAGVAHRFVTPAKSPSSSQTTPTSGSGDSSSPSA